MVGRDCFSSDWLVSDGIVGQILMAHHRNFCAGWFHLHTPPTQLFTQHLLSHDMTPPLDKATGRDVRHVQTGPKEKQHTDRHGENSFLPSSKLRSCVMFTTSKRTPFIKQTLKKQPPHPEWLGKYDYQTEQFKYHIINNTLNSKKNAKSLLGFNLNKYPVKKGGGAVYFST